MLSDPASERVLVKSPATHLLWTSAVGLAAIAGLLYSLHDANALDGFTGGVIGLVIAIWFILQVRSIHWQWSLDRTKPDVPEYLPIKLDDDTFLPDGISDELAASATTDRGAPGWLGLGATTLISLGLAGTFLGLTLGLFEALPHMQGEHQDVNLAIQELLDGAKLAFVKSLAGIGLAMLWNFRLLELRGIESNLQRFLSEELNKACPPITTEGLLARALEEQRDQTKKLTSTVKAIGKREGDLLYDLQCNLRTIAKQQSEGEKRLVQAIIGICGDEADTLLTIRQEVERLKETLQDLAEQLPEKIGVRAGQSVGTILQPKLDDLAKVLQALGTTGKEAIGDALKTNMGDEVSELRLALRLVSDALKTLPEQIAAGSKTAAGILSRASSTGAQDLSTAAAEVAKQTHAASSSVKDLRDALAATHELVLALQGGGAALRDSFTEVSRPLRALPKALDDARAGVESAGEAAGVAATRLIQAGDTAGSKLEEGAASAAEALKRASMVAGSELTGSATEAGQAMKSSGSQLAGQVKTAGEALRDGVANELKAIQGSLHLQRNVQAKVLDAWKAERSLVLEEAKEARTQLESIRISGEAFTKSVERLMSACEETASKLESVAGDQRENADKAIQDLLTAVGAFSNALEQNKGAIQDASLKSVATTEQITAEAARRVASALVEGAEGLKAAMERAEELGERINEQSLTLAQSMKTANVAANEMKLHGNAMLASSRNLKVELTTIAAPFSTICESLQQVAPTIQSATTSMEEERKALVGLGQSLQKQAVLIRKQEAALENRTSELRELHEVLGKQWSGHVGRMTEAHEQVRKAWQQAMRAATEGQERNAKEVGEYARRVERALGLKSEIAGLQTHLEDLAEALDKLVPTLRDLEQEIRRPRVGADGLSEAET